MVVAWVEHGAVYWVHNSLTDAAQNGELLAIAEQTEPVGKSGTPATTVGGGPGGRGRIGAAALPTRTAATVKTTLTETIGSIGGLLTLIAVPLLFLVLLRRRGDLSRLRGELDATLSLESQLRSTAETHRLRT
jgi:hypothetical protein